MLKLWRLTAVIWVVFFVSCAMAQERISASLLADTESGYLFLKHNQTQELAPASLTKLMTLYITFSAIDKGWLKWDDKLPVSEHAALQPKTNLDLYTGQTMTTRQAVDALIVHSANDAAVVLAEALAKDEAEFAHIMNRMAEQLNMTQTTFKNASGLHVEGQKTTARDMAILAMALIQHFPQYYPLFSQKSFDFNGRTYLSHNYVLQDYEGAEGMKTGYVAAVGYNLISTARKNGRRLLGIVMGTNSVPERDRMMMTLLDEGFQRVNNQVNAINQGQLNPAMDPLHRRFILPKTDVGLLAFEMPKHIRQALLQAKEPPVPLFSPIIHTDSGHLWTIQVGAFKSMERAVQMAERARTLLKTTQLKTLARPKASIYRAQLTGFTDKKGAVQACRFLNKNACPCFLVS